MHNFPKKRSDLWVFNAHKFPRKKLRLKVHKLLEESYVWPGLGLNVHKFPWFFGATALVEFQGVPAPLQEWEWYVGVAIGVFREPFQDNAVEPNYSPKPCCVASGCRKQMNITEVIAEIN